MLSSKERKEMVNMRRRIDELERDKYLLDKRVEELSSALEGKVV